MPSSSGKRHEILQWLHPIVGALLPQEATFVRTHQQDDSRPRHRGSGRRSDVEVAVLRRMMYTVLRGTLAAASVEASEYRTEDRGDGAFVLIDPSVPKPQLIRALLTHTPERLYDSNRLASSSVQVRLRIVVHSGEVTLDEHGALGADVVEAFRLLDTRELRAALESTTEASVLCVSDAVHRGVVRHRHPGIRAEHFHRFVTEAKEGELAGWIHDPRRVGHAPSAERPSPYSRLRRTRRRLLPTRRPRRWAAPCLPCASGRATSSSAPARTSRVTP